jgi:transcription-repair coupling factor (superfamily II helicase)
MNISELQQLYAAHPCLKTAEAVLEKSDARHIFFSGQSASSPSLFTSLLIKRVHHPFVIILDDLEEAGYFYYDLTQVLGEENIYFFPSSFRRAIKYGQKDAANEILRTEVLSALQSGTSVPCIVTYPDALAEKVVSREHLKDNTLVLSVGEKVDMKFIADVLGTYSFERVDYVYEPGQYAMRGSIIDVFSYSSEYPYRVDFFGDEVDSIRTFEVESQLSVEKKERVVIVPDLEKGAAADSMSFFKFVAPDTIFVMHDFLWLRERIQAVHDESLIPEAVVAQESEGTEKVSLEGQLIDGSEFSLQALDFRRVEFGTHPTGTPDTTLSFDTSPQPLFHKNFDLVSQSLLDYQQKGYLIYICSNSAKQTDRLHDIFEDRGDDIRFTAVEKTLHSGFVDNTLRMCIFTDHQIFDRFHKYNLKSDKARAGKVALSVKELQEFKPGDYVVHSDHGVGRFEGLVRIPNGDSTQEVLKIVYQNNDVVFVSIHSLHKVSKYKGKEGEMPRLNKLGTGAWERLKERTKTKIKDIARDLIKLYSQRKEEKGFAFSPDTYMQTELEASFIYEDTPDQSKATNDVKRDMEQAEPMDRLICGDVGFGKTEVAIRAAFKAVADDKQVAVLVPTTVLAYQHYQTFTDRLKEFPCTVDYLTRARSANQAKEIITKLKEGKVNILIGTQRMLGKDVTFKDLGLLIVDEEQKFGVAVKEKLRQKKVNVDTLTMTATPIPRTLQFSLMGARDLSVISTPPPNRYPIQTEVHTFNADIITEAINFEMSRNGQVFFVSNRIAGLPEIRDLIVKNIPDCRVAIGHGQMPPADLEKIVMGFINYDYDVLISTTIVENGVDIPNANTIIINAAQNFGLSDLHQMRGRVGRSNRKAFCYLLAPPLHLLNDESRRRLQAIENFSDLGSGIHIAMQDLDIRGAGNLLGADQSGFIADLGYETYQKILNEAVHELKTDEFADLYDQEAKEGTRTGEQYVDECQIESDLEMLLPSTYVTGSSERMLLYRELDSLTEDRDVEAFRTRLIDRFGPIPPETEELLRIVPLRRLAARLGIGKVFLKGGQMMLFFIQKEGSPYYQSTQFGKLIHFMMLHTRRTELRDKKGVKSMLIKDVPNVEEGVNVLKEMDAIVPKEG